RNESFFSAPQLKRDPLGRTLHQFDDHHCSRSPPRRFAVLRERDQYGRPDPWPPPLVGACNGLWLGELLMRRLRVPPSNGDQQYSTRWLGPLRWFRLDLQ